MTRSATQKTIVSNNSSLRSPEKKRQNKVKKSEVDKPFLAVIRQDARELAIRSNSIDLILTSPAYWRKRDYKVEGQIGQEKTSKEFAKEFTKVLREFKRVLKPTGSLFLNVGDTYSNRELALIPHLLESAAEKLKFKLRNRIIWVKPKGMPDPANNRLVSRHEFIFHLVLNHNYYYDLGNYAERFGNGINSGDVWQISPTPNFSSHLAPFPDEIVERIISLAGPPRVCKKCEKPYRREWRKTTQLNPDRPQARRAMEIAEEHGLTEKHIAAIQATGISDAGKALHFQTGAGRNSAEVKKLAEEAKKILGGYFREFTFPQKKLGDWVKPCNCRASACPGVVFDGFVGSGTTLRVAFREGLSAIGGDLKIYDDLHALIKQRDS